MTRPGFTAVEGADSQYARYMRTDELLGLQRRAAQRVYRDELLFQITHQSTELWLHLAGVEAADAVGHIRAGRPAGATLLLHRTSLAVTLCTEQLEMLRHLAPADFAVIRTVLGDGSGLQSPGWRALRRHSRALAVAFGECLAARQITLAGLYQGSTARPLYQLAEALIDVDGRVTLWRTAHYTIATRIIGVDAVGTRGTPVDALAALVHHTLFPKLWQARTGQDAPASTAQTS
jgi:tryptophan 2,3-dioxygenase